ncbi:MAG TPA: TrpB-like pyridoxal phosphate-dependent enzyme [Denitromonas sp.]|uniref:TrpB-like pyridoxal phosphate-dependent enzyme n=1 Tax=Denitromonas sp. TaxID=2734609 RepID=UPI001D4C9692|nr:TrpB-like pyridoxal phosphate-dependent enzyme [Rhodocyclaceae bacterium]MCP5222808.1 TrpB-like pyridoxal phosphate-dependent enzyme [Zoogloeaceae bacterium]HPR05643.1 TrpB-like pyridoxal phosphate-dependent enzyme [Denitromonas sp.]HQU89896.1 TrpB-like pyridoxal phosphate-dependent enzyme [Denitromonas sp.]HQV16109.1 TrpB-like pyridoxal phosphate-dependent enzyme [Denitromonas sp.]
MSEPTRILMTEEDIPTHWYNIAADMPNAPLPPLGPDGSPATPEQMSVIFPDAIIEQEMSSQRWIEIPDEVREIYKIWRPTPLVRAVRLEKALGTPAKIFFKYEGVSPAGSHKPNSAVPQAYYNKQAGIKRLTTETGAGQWGSSIAFAGGMFGIDVRVFMVNVSYQQKPFRRSMMQTWGAEVFSSPSRETQTGRAILEKDPDNQGSLGIAISEAVEEAAGRADTKYTLGSVLNHVLLHQTVIGQESKKQLEKIGLYPDVVIGPCGGGSSFGGIAFPFLCDQIAGEKRAEKLRCVAVEPASCPTLTKGAYAYDYGDASGFTPLMKMYTLGHDFMPPGIHAGGLRYHGDSPLVSQLYHEKLVEAVAVPQLATFEAGVLFARHEGIIPAPESCHGIRAAIDEALVCKQTGEPKVILFNLTGHGHFDMASYDRYFSGQLENYEYPAEAVAASLAHLPKVG